MAAAFEVGEPEQFEAQQSGNRLSPLHLIWRHRWLLVLGGVVGCVVAALYYARATPIYQSMTQVLVVNKGSRDALPTTSTDSGGKEVSTGANLSTHIVLISSPVIVKAAVQKANLSNLPSFAGSGDPTGAIIYSLKVVEAMSGTNPTNVLNLSFQSTHPQDIPVILEAIVESYRQFLNDRYKSGTDETAKLIVQANEILEQKIARKQQEYDAYLAQQPAALWRGKDGLYTVQARLASLEAHRSALLLKATEIQGRITALEKALKDGRYSRAELLAMLAEHSGGKETTSTMAMDERLMVLELQEKTLLEDYGPDHPQVRSVRDQLALLRAWMRRSTQDSLKDDSASVDLVKTRIQSLKLELENTKMASESVDKLLQKEQLEAKPLRSFEQRIESYRTDIDRSQKLFDTVAKRLNEISILKDFVGGYSAEIINPPPVGWKVAPKAFNVFAAGLVLGLVAGFGLAYLVELSDQSFRTPEEIRRQLGLPVVGHVPSFGRGDEEELPPADGLQVDPILCTAHRPKSREAEAYRGVRTALLFNREGGHNVIQVTSPDMGDGKSTLIANLAVSLAQAEKKVILIDADFRRPRIHKLFNRSADQGLASVMSGEAELNDVIQTTPIPGLSILPCGPIPPNPAELLTLPRFKELLACLREKYDFVLVDTPPLLAVTDPCVVVPHMDGVLLTVRISKNARPHALRAREILSTLGARVIGVVVNGVGSDVKGYGYGGYGYGYNYYYSYNYQDYYSSDDGEGEGTPADGDMDAPKKHSSASHRPSRKKTGILTWLFDR